MGSGTHAMISGPGLLRRRYSVPEIIMRKHSLSLQKSDDDETSAHSVPTPTSPRSPFVQSSGSDSNLTARGIFGGEISMRKSMLLRKIWSRDAQKRYDTRSGSWSPPLRRSQRRLTTAESVNAQNANKPCEVCSKLDEPVDVELEEKSPKRLRLTTSSSLVTTATNSPSSSSTIATTTPIKRQATTSTSPLAASPNSSSSSNGTSSVSSSRRQPTIVTQTTSKNVRIYMTPLDGSSTTDEHDVPQDVLRVEIEATHLPGDSSLSMTQSSSVSSLMVEHKNGNNAEVNDLQHGSIHTQLTADGNDIVDCFDTNCQNSSTTNENNINNHLNNNNAKSDTIANIDQFISQLLIDNLNNIVSIVSVSQNESVDDSNNNSSASNRGIQLDEEGNEQVIVSQVYLSPERLNEIVHRGSTTSTMKIEEKSSSSTENAPSYLADTNISVYSSQLSDAEFQEIQKQGSPEILSVNTGSTYPICQNQEPCIVPRQTNLIRTESLEVQPSSASAGEDDAQESGENSEESGSEDSISLVDSLDDPISPRHHEKSQAFFVPITDLEGNDDPHAEALSTSMPDKLREKLARRQLRLEMKKEDERIRKQKKMQKVMDRTLLQEAASERRTSRQKVHQPKKEVTEIMRVSKVKSNNLLRTEVGLLETYTIDARGNVQMKPTSMKKETGAIKRTQIVRKSTQQKTASTNSNGKNVDESVHKKKDVQKMTLYQSQANLTPDVEGGPRRMYQKTEIHDGQKCIEILEIVECLDSSPDCSPTRQYGYNSAQKNLKSKIPIPVHKPVRAIAFQRTTGTSIGELSSHQGFVRAIQTPSHNKVDRMIADLLIEALNRQEDSAIEFVTTPKDVLVRRPVIGRRSTPKRSTPNTRYQQVFEVIPEEKSSFSVDSSSEEQQPHVAQIQSSNAFEELSVHSIDSTPINPREHSNVEHHSAVVQVIDVAPSLQEKKFYAGKAGIDEETPKAWLGFFKRHDGSPFESANEGTCC